MRTPVRSPCATCGHSQAKHTAPDGACRCGWTYLHYAEKRCACTKYVPREGAT